MRKIHKLDRKYDGGKFSRSRGSYYEHELADPVGMAQKLVLLLASQDPEDRRDADRLVDLLRRAVFCPDGVWVCKCRYEKGPDGKRWSDGEVIWSAHLSREQAEAWHAFWVKHWRKQGGGYEMLPVQQQDRVPLHELVHPDARVGEGVSLR